MKVKIVRITNITNTALAISDYLFEPGEEKVIDYVMISDDMWSNIRGLNNLNKIKYVIDYREEPDPNSEEDVIEETDQEPIVVEEITGDIFENDVAEETNNEETESEPKPEVTPKKSSRKK